MSPIDKDELFQHISRFFESKGVELKDGPYKQGIQKGCNLMAEVANSSKDTLEKAKAQIDKTLDQVRQTIHEKTAPKAAPSQPPPPKPTPTPPPVVVKVVTPKKTTKPTVKKAPAKKTVTGKRGK